MVTLYTMFAKHSSECEPQFLTLTCYSVSQQCCRSPLPQDWVYVAKWFYQVRMLHAVKTLWSPLRGNQENFDSLLFNSLQQMSNGNLKPRWNTTCFIYPWKQTPKCQKSHNNMQLLTKWAGKKKVHVQLSCNCNSEVAGFDFQLQSIMHCYQLLGKLRCKFFSCGSSTFPLRSHYVLLKLLFHCLLTFIKANMHKLH